MKGYTRIAGWEGSVLEEDTDRAALRVGCSQVDVDVDAKIRVVTVHWNAMQ